MAKLKNASGKGAIFTYNILYFGIAGVHIRLDF